MSRQGRGPTKEFVELLRRFYARVEIIDEYKSSQVCSVCGRPGLRTLQTADRERPHAVRVCTHRPTVWARDTNAARNMLRLLKCSAASEGRPRALRGPSRREGGAVCRSWTFCKQWRMAWPRPLQWRMRLRRIHLVTDLLSSAG